jgi:hypothetical protein
MTTNANSRHGQAHYHVIPRAFAPLCRPRHCVDVILVRLPRKEVVVETREELRRVFVVTCR